MHYTEIIFGSLSTIRRLNRRIGGSAYNLFLHGSNSGGQDSALSKEKSLPYLIHSDVWL